MTLDSRVTKPSAPRRTETMTIAVMGLGYVGLPTALAMYDGAMRVVGLEVSSDRVERIRHGEPDLLPDDRQRLEAARRDPDRFVVTTDVAAAAEADAVIVCVPTPVDASLTPDLTWLRTACATVVACARPGQVLILTSTSYVGCTRDLLTEPLSRRGLSLGKDIFVAFCPGADQPGQ